MNDPNIIRIGETAYRLAECFGTDRPLPFKIPVWVADPNCEFEPWWSDLIQLRSANGGGGEPDYADLSAGTVSALSIFFRGDGYRSPEPMQFDDEFGTFTQLAQRRQP